MKNQSSKTKPGFKSIFEGIRKIVTIDLTCKATNVLEKFLWILMGLLGAIWAIYFIVLLFVNENPIIIFKDHIQLSEIEYPSITICPSGSTKFAIAERLGNYIDHTKMSEELIFTQNMLLYCVISTSLQQDFRGSCNDYNKACKNKRNLGCKVID